MNTVRRTPAMVTMIPAERRTTTPIRSRRGMCKRMIIGMGRIVHSKSATQLITPAAMVITPSSRQWPSTTSGKVQYFRTGLGRDYQRSTKQGKKGQGKTYTHPKIPMNSRTMNTARLKKRPKCIDHLYHLIVLSLIRR